MTQRPILLSKYPPMQGHVLPIGALKLVKLHEVQLTLVPKQVRQE